MTEKARSLDRVDKVAQNLRRKARDEGTKLNYVTSQELAAKQCGFSTYSQAVIELPVRDPRPAPRT